MTPQDIKKTLIDRNLAAAEIARDLGLSRQAVNAVIHWRRRTPWVRRGIAKALGIPYVLVWGEEDPGVDRLPRGRRAPASDDKSIKRIPRPPEVQP